jgi:ubiquitin related modifier 1
MRRWARSGGLELLFGNKKVHDVDTGAGAAPGSVLPLSALLAYLREHLLKERPELFMQGSSV